MESGRRPTFVLVHGACWGPACWEALAPRLEIAGHRVVAVALPSAGADVAGLGDLYADAAAVREATDACDEAIVVCHSYGGAPTTDGLAGATNVQLLVYLAAFMLAEGEMLADLDGDDADDWIISEDDATIAPSDPARLLFGHCPPAVASRAVTQLVPQAVVAFEQQVRRAAWRDIRSTYVICEDDRAISPPLQHMMAQRADSTHAIFSDHSPFLSHPDETAALLLELAAGGESTSG